MLLSFIIVLKNFFILSQKQAEWKQLGLFYDLGDVSSLIPKASTVLISCDYTVKCSCSNSTCLDSRFNSFILLLSLLTHHFKVFSGLYKPDFHLKKNLSSSIGGHSVQPGTRVLVNMWSIHHDPKQWEKPDLFNPGTSTPPRSRNLSIWSAPNQTALCFSHLIRSLYWQARPAGHPLLLPAIWGGTSSLCRRILGQTGALPLLVIAVTANEFQAAQRCPAAQFTGSTWRRAPATAFQCCCTAPRKHWPDLVIRLKNRSWLLIVSNKNV